MKIYNEKEQFEKGKKQNAQFEGKMDTRSTIELNPVFKAINRLRNEIKEVGTLGQDLTQLSFQLVKGIKESFRARCVSAHL